MSLLQSVHSWLSQTHGYVSAADSMAISSFTYTQQASEISYYHTLIKLCFTVIGGHGNY